MDKHKGGTGANAQLKKAKSTLGGGQKKKGGKKKSLKDAASKVALASQVTQVITAWEHGDVEHTDGPQRYSSTQASEAVTSQAETVTPPEGTSARPPGTSGSAGLGPAKEETNAAKSYQAFLVDDDDDEEEDWDSLIASVMGEEEIEETKFGRLPRWTRALFKLTPSFDASMS